MQITRFTDYSLMVLMYLSVHSDGLSNIANIATSFNISKNHLVKVVHHLAKTGLIDSVRGRSGGIRLAQRPEEIRIGNVVRQSEQTLEIVDCHKPACPLLPSCKLKRVLNEAKQAFYQVLDEYTLADISQNKKLLLRLIA
jgi:Rrf2 family nitric oxide-sensitive transcriptional repressor